MGYLIILRNSLIFRIMSVKIFCGFLKINQEIQIKVFKEVGRYKRYIHMLFIVNVVRRRWGSLYSLF